MRLLWADLETSGLDPTRHAILEVAVGLADLADPFTLKTMDRFVLRFADVHTFGRPCREPSVALVGRKDDDGPCPACDFSPEARAMHEKTGLLEECRISTATIGDVEAYLLTLVHGQPERGDDKPTLAGSSVHFDHGFLRVHMPRFAARVSHRHYDVSAVKLFCESLGMPRIAKALAHSATADIQESVRHAKACAEWLRAGPWFTDAEALAALRSNHSFTDAVAAPRPCACGHAQAEHVLPYSACRVCLCSTFEAAAKQSLCNACGHAEGDHSANRGCLDRECHCERFVPNDLIPASSLAAMQFGDGTLDGAPDAQCATTPDGGCASTDPRDMHRPKGA